MYIKCVYIHLQITNPHAARHTFFAPASMGIVVTFHAKALWRSQGSTDLGRCMLTSRTWTPPDAVESGRGSIQRALPSMNHRRLVVVAYMNCRMLSDTHIYTYTGVPKVALLDLQNITNPFPLESYVQHVDASVAVRFPHLKAL